jgi:hypothetical protein
MPRQRSSTDTEAVRSVRIERPPRPADSCCTLCGQPLPLSFHHLIPRKVHAQRWVRLRHDAARLDHDGIWICRPCHDFLHGNFSERELGERLHTLDRLQAEPLIARHIAWAARQKRKL